MRSTRPRDPREPISCDRAVSLLSSCLMVHTGSCPPDSSASVSYAGLNRCCVKTVERANPANFRNHEPDYREHYKRSCAVSLRSNCRCQSWRRRLLARRYAFISHCSTFVRFARKRRPCGLLLRIPRDVQCFLKGRICCK